MSYTIEPSGIPVKAFITVVVARGNVIYGNTIKPSDNVRLSLIAVATKAVVATPVELFPLVWVTAIVPVGKVGVPVNVGDARLAFNAKAVVVKAVVAIAVELFPGDCVTAVVPVGKIGVPVKVGDAIFAFKASAVVTKAVVAIAVVLFPGD